MDGVRDRGCRVEKWRDRKVVKDKNMEREGVIPKSCHHHVIRPLTSMFSLNPNTWSGNLLYLSILLEKT